MNRVAWMGALALAAALPLAGLPAQAQLKVSVTPNDLDEDDPQCFMHGTLSTQTVDVTNQGAAPVLATLYCSVPGQALRVAAISPPETIAAGATARLYCSLYDYQDPPDAGAVVSFDVDVNGQVSKHAVTLRCRPTPLPAERCAAARLAAEADACGDRLAALGAQRAGGDAADVEVALARAAHMLEKRIVRSEEKVDGACSEAGGLDAAFAALGSVEQLVQERAASLQPDACGAGALGALASKCRADLRAWSRYARGGDSARLEAALARSDSAFEKHYAKALAAQACEGGGERDWLRLAVEDAVSALARGEGLQVGDGPAELLRSAVTFAAGEREKRLWLAMPGTGALVFDRGTGLHATAFDAAGTPLAVGGEEAAADEPVTAELALPGPEGHVPIVLRRSGDLRRQRSVILQLRFDDAEADFENGIGFFSPLRTFPGGEDVHELPVGAAYGDFDAYVLGEWGYPLSFGLDAVEWFALQTLPFAGCPAAAPGATPPPGATHDRNECGISTFIHSMQGKFPGALPATVTTNPKQWDAVAETIGHHNAYGTPLLTENVNDNLSGAKTELTKLGPLVVGTHQVAQPSGTLDGKFYCGGRIGDEKPANLAAWGEDCDLKLLVFDVSELFGHWVDVNQVTPDPNDPEASTLQLQDYAKSYDVACTHSTGTALDTTQIDFSVDPAATGSVMRKNFGASNPIAGDARDESVSFWVVCECDRTDPLNPTLPKQTKSGKSLKP